MKALAAALLTALLTAASFPPFDLSYAAFFALLPLLLATGGGSGRRDFFTGWLAGWAASTAVVWWVINTVTHYGGISWVLAVPLLLLMTWGMGFFWGVFAWARGRMRRRWPVAAAAVLSPAVWVALEFARGHLPDIAFPWALLGYTQYLNLNLVQIADYGGVWAVSFLVVAVNCALASLFEKGAADRSPGPAARAVPLVLAAVCLLLARQYGAYRLEEAPVGRKVQVAVVQGNIEQEQKWDPAFRRSTFGIYASLTAEAAREGTDLVVWPETSTPFFYQREPLYQQLLADLAVESGTPILFGAPAAEGYGPGASLRNRAYLLDGSGELRGWYDKLHLVPFGEYVPWRRALFFVDKLVQAVGEFTPGEEAVVLETDGVKFGTLICYEVIFPDLVRRFVLQGADFLVNITNDAWFGRTAASRQHFSTLVFRAVENRRPLARAANTGISGFVDSRGRILETSELFVRGTYIADLETSAERTFYTVRGDVAAWLCVAIALAATAATFAGSRTARKNGRF